MSTDLPKTTNCVILDEKNVHCYGELPLGEIGENHVLVKIHSAAINPSDVMFCQGFYPAEKSRPCVPGFEGSGVVVAVGSSEKSQALNGANVCFFSSGKDTKGSWGEYTIIENSSVFPIPQTLTLQEGACSLVNPLTVEGFIHTSQEKGYTAIVHTAAASALGKMLVFACKHAGITLINVVRREEQVEILKSIGAENIINTGEQNWKETCTVLFKELKPQALFDAVGGKTASELFSLMPANSTTYNYGGLSGEGILASIPDLIFKNKTLTGWWLSNFLANHQVAGKLFAGAFKNLALKNFTTDIAKTFPFEQYKEALAFYAENSSKGKTLLQNPNF